MAAEPRIPTAWTRLFAAELASPAFQALTTSARFTYLVLLVADFSAGAPEIRHLSLGGLASRTGYHRRTVRKAINELVKGGLLISRPRFGRLRPSEKPRQLANEYEVMRVGKPGGDA